MPEKRTRATVRYLSVTTPSKIVPLTSLALIPPPPPVDDCEPDIWILVFGHFAEVNLSILLCDESVPVVSRLGPL